MLNTHPVPLGRLRHRGQRLLDLPHVVQVLVEHVQLTEVLLRDVTILVDVGVLKRFVGFIFFEEITPV